MTDLERDKLELATALHDADRAIATAEEILKRRREEGEEVDFIIVQALDMAALLEQAGRLVRVAHALNPAKPT